MKSRHQPAFATVAALVMMGLIGATLASMGIMFTLEFRRTTSALEQAELRQLLLAGAADAMSRSAGWRDGTSPPPKWGVAVPDELRTQGALVSVTVRKREAGSIELTVDAALSGRTARQKIHFARKRESWELDAAELR